MDCPKCQHFVGCDFGRIIFYAQSEEQCDFYKPEIESVEEATDEKLSLLQEE